MNLSMQGDGNLVLYAPGMSARWQSGTSGHPGAWLQLQPDGNLVIYAPGAVPLWSSMGAGAGPANFLQVQDDGNLVLYNSALAPVWNSNTFYFPSAVTAQAALTPGAGLQSPNGQYTLRVGNTSVDFFGPAGREWQISSGGRPITQLVAQADGNLVLYTTQGVAWATMTNTQPGGLFQVQDDGNVVMYSASVQPLWWSSGATNVDRGTVAPPTSKAQIAIAYAERQIGKPYVWGASGEATFDCSGLTMAAWAQAGIPLVHKAQKQYDNGAKYPIAQRQPGDLIFYGSSSSSITHVALYIGGDRIIHAAGVNSGVKYANYNYSSKYIRTVVRPTG